MNVKEKIIGIRNLAIKFTVEFTEHDNYYVVIQYQQKSVGLGTMVEHYNLEDYLNTIYSNIRERVWVEVVNG